MYFFGFATRWLLVTRARRPLP